MLRQERKSYIFWDVANHWTADRLGKRTRNRALWGPAIKGSRMSPLWCLYLRRIQIRLYTRLGVFHVPIPRLPLSWMIRSHVVVGVGWLQCAASSVKWRLPFSSLSSNWVSTISKSQAKKRDFPSHIPRWWRKKKIPYSPLSYSRSNLGVLCCSVP